MTTDRLVNVIAEALQCDASGLSESTGLGRHPRWDSLGHIDVMAMLEKMYNIEVTEQTVTSLTTIAEIRNYLQKLGSVL